MDNYTVTEQDLLEKPRLDAIAAKAFEMTNLGYLGADIVLDKYRGPMMLELNARPGLAIQIANGRGLAGIVQDIEKNYPKNLNWQDRIDFVLNHT